MGKYLRQTNETNGIANERRRRLGVHYEIVRRRSSRRDTTPERAVIHRGTRAALLPLVGVYPGGAPRVTEGVAAVDTDVTTWPSDVMRNVTSVGTSDSVWIAVAFGWRVFRAGEYVLVARPEDTISPIDAGTEVLKA